MPGEPSPEPPRGFLQDLFQTRYREVTVSAIVFAILIGIVMNAAITYAGLKIGFTLGGSAIAAVLGFGVLRGILRKGSILETNIAQTIASAVNTSNSGVIFTVPVLFLLGYTLSITGADFWMITAACVAGALLGTAFIIPLRKQMIDIERLRFPSPTAVASILKSPGAGAAKAAVLGLGVLAGVAIFLPTQLETLGFSGLGSIPGIGADHGGFLGNETVDAGTLLGLPAEFQLVFAIAPFALGAGYLTGRPGLYVLAGGILAYFLINPLAFRLGWVPETLTAAQVPGYAFNAFNRPLGIGLLLGGALMGVLFSLPAIREAIRSIAAASHQKAASDELGLRTLVVTVIVALVLLYAAADLLGGRPVNVHCPVTGGAVSAAAETAEIDGYTIAFSGDAAAATWAAWSDAERAQWLESVNARPGLLARFNPHLRALVIAIVGAAWIWFAGIIIAQCAGMTDWSPVSGLALLTVVLVLLLAGSGAVVAAVLLGAALCCAITLAADMMGDMKTGYLVGAQPRRQQVMELVVVGIGPVICMLTVMLIAGANMKEHGIAIGPGTPTVAPQAQALQAVITGVQGGEMPYALYGFGALLGMLLGVGVFPGLGVLIGLSMYLPFMYIATYGLGCIANIIVARIKGRTWAEDWGVPFCAGLIVGESVLALLINMYVLMR
jgi:uncharacterized oligopeptide transporter (OPT) family protein